MAGLRVSVSWHQLHSLAILMVMPGIALRCPLQARGLIRGAEVARALTGLRDFHLGFCEFGEIGVSILVELNAGLWVNSACEMAVPRATARRLLRRLAARRIVHHHPARAHEVACGALDVEVVHDLGPRVRRDADDGRGARAGRDEVAGREVSGAAFKLGSFRRQMPKNVVVRDRCGQAAR